MVEKLFIQGNEACALGAIKAGCRFFAGYPITPSTEVAENLARLLPKYGGSFVQMEDEISSMGAVIGASWGGSKAMTATSGPGISLMQENLGYAFMTETPLVIVNVQRGSPSTGQPTMASQSDMMQVRWGSHGDYEPIALSPSSVQEYFDFTIKAFNLSEKYRVPVFLMTEESIGHMREKISIPKSVDLVARKEPTMSPDEFLPFKNRKNATNPMPAFGDGYKVHVSGLTHNEIGYPDTNNPKTHAVLVKRLCNKILKNREKITSVKSEFTDDADVVVVCYGAPVRSVTTAVKEAREEGIKAGYLKINTPWPFPDDDVKAVCESAKDIIVPEMNLGQMVHEVERVFAGDAEVHLLSKIGGELPKPSEVLNAIKSVGGN
ncbi:2-oxoglutarate synthase subunit alpha [Methanobrevibacter sp. 87.7]|uniref:2-oxoacid:acceptor oxidoreductase subunit alpha n=1 Tax=Methanobrevibacter sp. 87.7 TaxID=387957 RepID=UPI000B505502|nr:2-oxoacid:acceptor oxidoreductase subunit alpha [Methanobrevibacter sp. 87.7]OWT32759.1 2-oxoglutarate synthase subunit alpha [Methanobrevibacter sp. 87.7]